MKKNRGFRVSKEQVNWNSRLWIGNIGEIRYFTIQWPPEKILNNEKSNLKKETKKIRKIKKVYENPKKGKRKNYNTKIKTNDKISKVREMFWNNVKIQRYAKRAK